MIWPHKKRNTIWCTSRPQRVHGKWHDDHVSTIYEATKIPRSGSNSLPNFPGSSHRTSARWIEKIIQTIKSISRIRSREINYNTIQSRPKSGQISTKMTEAWHNDRRLDGSPQMTRVQSRGWSPAPSATPYQWQLSHPWWRSGWQVSSISISRRGK